MIVSQRYAGRSFASLQEGSLDLTMYADVERPPVRLSGTVRNGLSYARVMLSFHALVASDLRGALRNRDDYFAWVRDRYLDELPETYVRHGGGLPALAAERDRIQSRIAEVQREVTRLTDTSTSAFATARRRYWAYLYEHDRDAWVVLDPVVSVHPDALLFEAFSHDESSYGRVTVPVAQLDLHGPVEPGTTNIDFSPELAREMKRIRSYRPADLYVGPGEVVQATSAGAAVEKKIELPESWIRGFLQVQSAAALPGTELRLSAATLAEILSVLRQRRDKTGPRSLRFLLQNGSLPTIVIDPWDIRIRELHHVFQGVSGDIRIWGRRRLLVLEDLLPHAEVINVRLLGTGMPSYWSVCTGEMRLDIGLSGWTRNDWAKAARFDLLASGFKSSEHTLPQVRQALQVALKMSSEEAARATRVSQDEATAALQELCRQGEAMYDFVERSYRRRQLLGPGVAASTVEDPAVAQARRIVQNRGVQWTPVEGERRSAPSRGPVDRKSADVQVGRDPRHAEIEIDRDGRVVYAECTCYDFRKNKLRQGPCVHILASAIAASA